MDALLTEDWSIPEENIFDLSRFFVCFLFIPKVIANQNLKSDKV